jgi:hypothetical protein
MADSILVHNLRFLIFLKHFPIEYIMDPMRGESEEEGEREGVRKGNIQLLVVHFLLDFLHELGHYYLHHRP